MPHTAAILRHIGQTDFFFSIQMEYDQQEKNSNMCFGAYVLYSNY